MKKIIGIFILICLILSDTNVRAYTNFNADELVKNAGFNQAQVYKKLVDDLEKDDENSNLFKNLDKNQILRYKMAFGALSFHKNRLKKDNLKDSESEFIKSLLMFSSSLKFEDRELLYTSYRHGKEDDAFDFRVPSEIFIKTLKELFNIDFKDEYIKNINGAKNGGGFISFKSDSPLNFVSTYTFITNVKKKGDYFIFKTDNLIQVFDYEDNIKNEFVNPYFILVKKDEKNGALQTLYCTGEDFDFEDAVNKYDIDIVNRYFTDDDISKINNENISSYISYIKERLGLKDFTENDKMASEDKEILKKICDGAEIKYMSVETAGNSVLLDNKFFKIYAKNYDDVSNFKRYLYSISSDEYFKKPVKVYIYSAEKDAEIYIDMMTVLLNNDFADIYILRKESGTAFNIALKEAIINCGSSIYVGEGDEPEINIFKDGKHIDGAKPFFSLQKAQESNGNIAKLSLENLRILEQKLVEDKDMRPYSVTKEKRKVYIIIACSVFIIIILFILIYIIRKRISSEEKKESRIVSADKMFDEEKK